MSASVQHALPAQEARTCGHGWRYERTPCPHLDCPRGHNQTSMVTTDGRRWRRRQVWSRPAWYTGTERRYYIWVELIDV